MVRLYHGSAIELPVGLVLTGRGDQYESAWSHTDFYAVLEQFRPAHCIPHLSWDEGKDAWEATARHAGLAECGQGASSAQAMFGALEALAEQANELTQDQTPERKTFGAGASRT